MFHLIEKDRLSLEVQLVDSRQKPYPHDTNEFLDVFVLINATNSC